MPNLVYWTPFKVSTVGGIAMGYEGFDWCCMDVQSANT